MGVAELQTTRRLATVHLSGDKALANWIAVAEV